MQWQSPLCFIVPASTDLIYRKNLDRPAQTKDNSESNAGVGRTHDYTDRYPGLPTAESDYEYMSDKKHPYAIIDLFAGAGGLTLGFERLSKGRFKPVWANDFDTFAAKTYSHNFDVACTVGDIVDILSNPDTEIPAADLVIGGPPCQGFSMLNKNRESDPRKELWRPFFEVVLRSGASTFVMENVPDLLRSEEYQHLKAEAEKMGFRITSARLCAADYGVPQTRTRAFVVGCKFADPSEYFPPKKTHYNPAISKPSGPDFIRSPKPWVTVREAIGSLPPPKGTEIRDCEAPLNLHFGRTPTETSLARYKAIPKPGMNRFDLQRNAPELTPNCWLKKPSGSTDIFGRLWWDRPAVTMRTEFFKPEKGRYLHPVQHRPITHREAARFQSFPDDFVFDGTKIEIAKQIGNAVPPLLAAAVANCVYEMMGSNSNDGCLQVEQAKRDYVSRQGQKHKAGVSGSVSSSSSRLPVPTARS